MLPSNNFNNLIYETNNHNTDDYSLVTNYNANLFSPIASSSLSYFPASPFNHYDTDYFFLEPYQHLPLEEETTTKVTNEVNEMTTGKIVDNSSNNNNEVIVEKNNTKRPPPRNRSSKKDRHSKIITAKGTRDRRMRLSLEIAREFFGLQDMLGFDKASATVEWLLTKAKHDIKKLFPTTSIPSGRPIHTIDSSSAVFGAKSGSSTPESCEVISGIIDHPVKPISKGGTRATKEKTKHKEVHKPVVRCIQRTRDMRAKAREKARERTKVKKFAETNVVLVEESNHVGSSWTPPLDVEKTAGMHERVCAGAPINIMDTNADESFQSFAMMEKWSPASIFSHLQGRTDVEHQIEDFQVYGDTWDSYNIQNLL